MKTLAAILVEQNQPLIIDQVEIPILKNGQVLVRVLASGLCRSQINEIRGLKGPDAFLPHLLGHEGAGIVEVVATGVKKVKPGDSVVMTWIKAEGLEAGGAQYQWGEKIVNSGAIATLTEYAVVSENRLVKISKQVPAGEAALLGCAVPTGAGMVFKNLNVKKGMSLAVFGVGGIGAAAILAAKSRGCHPIIGVDVSKEKLKFAQKLGATNVYQSSEFDKSYKTILPKGIDAAVEASGQKAAMEQAFRSLSDQGTLVIAGNLSKGDTITIDPFDLIKGKNIVGTWGGETVPDTDIPQYVRLYRKGQLTLSELITHRFHLQDINQAISVLESGQAGRVIIEF